MTKKGMRGWKKNTAAVEYWPVETKAKCWLCARGMAPGHKHI